MSMQKYQDIFEYSIQHQQPAAQRNEQNQEGLTKERRAWLEKAINQYVQDEVGRMKQIKENFDQVKNWETISQEELQQKIQILEELIDIVCNLDYARDFNKIGGLPTLLNLLSNPHADLRWRAAEVIATSAQNNLPVQSQVLQDGTMQKLIQMMEHDNDNVCVTKALLAISSLVRHNDVGLKGFVLSGGVIKLVKLLDYQDERLQRKALFLIQYMIAENSQARQTVIDIDIFKNIKKQLQSQNTDIQESSLDITCKILEFRDLKEQIQDQLKENKILQILDSYVEKYHGRNDEDTAEIQLKFQQTYKLAQQLLQN